MELNTLNPRKDPVDATVHSVPQTPQNLSKSRVDLTSVPTIGSTGRNGHASTNGHGSAGGELPITHQQKILARIQFLSLCWTLFLAGWNDGSTGPLLPRIQEVYHVGFTIVSLIFVFACVGFIAGAVSNIHLTDKLGFGKTIVFGSLCQIVAYAIQAGAPPFPVFVLAYTINGVGLALQDAQANGFVATLKDHPESKMGVLHAAYGLGAFASPLVATQFAQLPRWSFHYLASLGIAVSNTIILISVFKLQRQDGKTSFSSVQKYSD
ncbi:hypothetical protein CVT26_000057 [Gymnopilus dilepis]|uniref:Major facilitator superfamily (MFS) profile domain-containing protein n=1 Tax=Gymnopilus dilepis TaxID=231916 RepID=A0A409VGG3_9AGAR|nr:hypothetical protein CVT26_000057 [Gymnopilus dilepis]